jgi:hypothetical protein
MPTLKEQIAQLTAAQHKLAVWEAIYAYLDANYVPRDSGSAQKAIRVSDCLVELVPSEIIEDILQTISDGPIKEFRDEIIEIESNEVLPVRKAGA